MQKQINFKGIELNVHYYIDEGERIIWNYGGGDGYPGTASEYKIISISPIKEDISNLLKELDVLDDIIDLLK